MAIQSFGEWLNFTTNSPQVSPVLLTDHPCDIESRWIVGETHCSKGLKRLVIEICLWSVWRDVMWYESVVVSWMRSRKDRNWKISTLQSNWCNAIRIYIHTQHGYLLCSIRCLLFGNGIFVMVVCVVLYLRMLWIVSVGIDSLGSPSSPLKPNLLVLS